MKKIMILIITLIFLTSTFGALPVMADADRVLPFQCAHSQVKNLSRASNYMNLSKDKVTLSKGKSTTLKATLDPYNSKAKLTWTSSNPNIAMVSSSGKITAVAQGKVYIKASAPNYYDGYCTVTVKGDSNEPKLIGADDYTFYYGKTKLRTEQANDKDLYSKILRLIPGGFKFNDKIYYSDFGLLGLAYGSSNRNNAHTVFWFDSINNDFAYYGGFHTFFATSDSPVKTSRGIVIGSKKSEVIEQYGLPTLIKQGNYSGKIYEYYYYEGSYFFILFAFQKSKGSVDYMSYSYQNNWIHYEIKADWFMSFYNGKLLISP